jgi:hypothetical protein
MTATLTPRPVVRVAARPPVRRPAARLEERVYRRRRAVVAFVLVVLGAGAGSTVHDLLAGPGGVPASAAGDQPAIERVVLTARPGDTLWSIASAHRGPIDLDDYLDALIDRNGGTALQVGQAVVLP